VKAPFSWPKSSLSDEALGDGRAVEGDEGARGARARAVYEAGEEFLARAVLARDEDAGLRGGGLEGEAFYVGHGRRRAHELLFGGELGSALQGLVLGLEGGELEGVPHRGQEALDGQGLLDEIEGTELHGPDRHVYGAVAREHDDGELRLALLDLPERLEAAHARQPDVEEERVDLFAVESLEADDGVLGDDGPVALVLQDAAHRASDAGFVVYHENGRHGRFLLSYLSSGRSIKKVAPRPSADSKRMEPP